MASRWSGRTATSGGSTSAASTAGRTRRRGSSGRLRLALRLAGHRGRVREIVGDDPVLLLDDVFSELDEHRAARSSSTSRPARRC